jgi:glycosyltransferase involved in cell wall biosynthesis
VVKEPLVSVIIIFLNAERFIEEAIASVFAQSYAHWELLLVDDGSTDRSTNLARRYATERPSCVRYLEHEQHQNLGMSATRNLGIKHAHGEYVAFLDADDCWLPHKLERQVAILMSHPQAAMVYGPAQFWYSWSGDSDDQERDFITELGVAPDALIPPPELLIRCLQNKPPVPLPSLIMVRRQALVEVGGFEERFQGRYQLHEDLAFSSKLFLRAPVYVTSECLSKYRQHPDSLGSFWAQRGEYHPGRPHAAQAFFLDWFEDYLSKQGVNDGEVWQALQQALRPYRHQIAYRLSERARLLRQDIKWLLSNIFIMASRRAKLALHKSTGFITANPNPVQTKDVYGLGKTTLAWHSDKTETVEVRIGSPDGPLLSRSGPRGSATTGTWVSNGMVFFLQDVTDGLPLTLANTLATVTITVHIKNSNISLEY